LLRHKFGSKFECFNNNYPAYIIYLSAKWKKKLSFFQRQQNTEYRMNINQ